MMPSKRETLSIIRHEAVTILDVLRLHVEEQPNSVGFNFLEIGASLTYSELD